MTTYGVGELSAINAIAGSFAENVPVVHIAGSPSTNSQRKKQLLHHTLGDGDFRVFAEIYSRVTVAQAILHDASTATALIDSTLRECWIKQKPVYIELPTNMVTVEVDATPLEKPIDLSQENPEKDEQAAVSAILQRLYQAQQPILLIDALVSRFRLDSEVDALVRKSNLPTFVTPMAKSAVDETLPNFYGLYAGSGSKDSIRKYVGASDLVLHLGPVKSDYNTTGFTYGFSTKDAIELYPHSTSVGDTHYDIYFRGLISRLTSSLDVNKLSKINTEVLISAAGSSLEAHMSDYAATTVTQDYLWPKLTAWLKPNDILLTETGTACHGVWATTYPKNLTAIAQTLWASIGYTLPAAQGAAVAARELGRPGRIILFEGDGSAQLTAQAIGTMIAQKLDIIIFLINNEGYTIERWVHGMEAKYNDIAEWRYADLPRTMGGTDQTVKSFVVRTKAELEALWNSDEFQKPTGMKVSLNSSL